MRAAEGRLADRLAQLRETLRLSLEQERQWPAYESALQALSTAHRERMATGQGRSRATDPTQRLRQRAEGLSRLSAALARVAEAQEPLYNSLDEAQKLRFAEFSTASLDSFPGPLRDENERYRRSGRDDDHDRGRERRDRDYDRGDDRDYDRGGRYGRGYDGDRDRRDRATVATAGATGITIAAIGTTRAAGMVATMTETASGAEEMTGGAVGATADATEATGATTAAGLMKTIVCRGAAASCW